MLQLRPHHLLDIIRNIGLERPIVPHPYGHAQHAVTRAILSGKKLSIQLVVGADDICRPCIHLTDRGVCNDVLTQLEKPVKKQHYNDELDHKVLAYMGLTEGATISIDRFLDLVEQKFNGLAAICTHPLESERSRARGMERGLLLLKTHKND